MTRLSIDGMKVEAKPGETVLEAALRSGIYIPGLCYHPDLPPAGACRLCIVEIEGMKGFPASCTTVAKEGMVVRTDTPEILELRRKVMWLILSEHPADLEESSQLRKVAEWIGAEQALSGFVPVPRDLPAITDEPLFIRDPARCILCERCVRMCQEIRGAGAIGLVNRGVDTVVGTDHDSSLSDAGCRFCEACVEVCPSGALADKERFDEKDREKTLLPCVNTCPAGIDVARYVRLTAEGRFQDALEVIREKVPFPRVLGCVCDHPCEEACRRGEVNEPIAIKALKRFVAEQDSGRWKSAPESAADTGKRVAVVGSGPAGLTAAWFLRKAGHSVLVFEAMSEAGGMMRTCIPGYRLPRDVLDREIREIENAGVKIKTGSEIGSLDELFDEGFDAVFVASGAADGVNMGIPGENDPRVLDGISLLRDVNSGREAAIAGEVAVVGGGNVAVDAARSALRAGSEKVTILYRRTRDEMPAAREEVEEALKEGVNISFLVAPCAVLPERGKLKVRCVRMELGEPDADGRRRPVPVDGSEFTMETDRLITAIGQKPAVPEGFGLSLDKKGCIAADAETLSCSRDGVFAGGDVVTGPGSVIEAIQAGRKAACSIDRRLGGSGLIDRAFIPEEEEDPCLGRDEGFAYRSRVEIPGLPVDRRLDNFSQVEGVLDEKAAKEEAERCLRCQLRLRISRPTLPPL